MGFFSSFNILYQIFKFLISVSAKQRENIVFILIHFKTFHSQIICRTSVVVSFHSTGTSSFKKFYDDTIENDRNLFTLRLGSTSICFSTLAARCFLSSKIRQQNKTGVSILIRGLLMRFDKC